MDLKVESFYNNKNISKNIIDVIIISINLRARFMTKDHQRIGNSDLKSNTLGRMI